MLWQNHIHLDGTFQCVLMLLLMKLLKNWFAWMKRPHTFSPLSPLLISIIKIQDKLCLCSWRENKKWIFLSQYFCHFHCILLRAIDSADCFSVFSPASTWMRKDFTPNSTFEQFESMEKEPFTQCIISLHRSLCFFFLTLLLFYLFVF